MTAFLLANGGSIWTRPARPHYRPLKLDVPERRRLAILRLIYSRHLSHGAGPNFDSLVLGFGFGFGLLAVLSLGIALRLGGL